MAFEGLNQCGTEISLSTKSFSHFLKNRKSLGLLSRIDLDPVYSGCPEDRFQITWRRIDIVMAYFLYAHDRIQLRKNRGSLGPFLGMD